MVSARLTRVLPIFLAACLVFAALSMVYRPTHSVFHSSFLEAVDPDYNLSLWVSGMVADIAVETYVGQMLAINITESLPPGSAAVVPDLVNMDREVVHLNLTARGWASESLPEKLTISVYLPQTEVDKLRVHLDVGSIRVLGVFTKNLDLYAALGEVYVNITELFGGGTYMIGTQTGNIKVVLPANQGVTLNATTINGKIELDGKPVSTGFYGELGGGGPLVTVYSVDGTVTIEWCGT